MTTDKVLRLIGTTTVFYPYQSPNCGVLHFAGPLRVPAILMTSDDL